MDWGQVRRNIADFFHGMALAGYEKRLREQLMDLNDLFMLLCFMELVGLPNPATIYLMEIYPYFRRISPLASKDGHGSFPARRSSLLLSMRDLLKKRILFFG